MKQLRAWIMVAVALLISACASTSSTSSSSQRPAAGGPDLSGTWELTTESQVGTEQSEMTVRQTGTALAGTISGRAGKVGYTGSVDGSAVAFDFVLEVRGMELKLDYSGLLEGDTMKGKAVFGQFGEGTFTAKRK
jgi:hypothetical protein